MAVTLPVLVAGCATDRLVEVNTGHIQVESPNSGGLTATAAVEVFQEVASQLGFVVKGPIRASESEFDYSADAARETRRNKTWLLMSVDEYRASVTPASVTPHY